ncbi:MAG TPA: hypothetical protein V6C96_05670 [Vampirovibrionales bacterium]
MSQNNKQAALFDLMLEQNQNVVMPLAEKLRPQTLNDFIDSAELLKEESPLTTLFEAKELTSLIFWGPPGCGKTSLCRIY